MMLVVKYCLLIVCIFTATSSLRAEVKLPQLVSDSMVLQRDQPIKIWGWAKANEKVTVYFNYKKYNTKANEKGNWQVYFPPTKAGGPYNINIVASNTILLKEVLFGDVWFCSGQSNMVHQMNIHDVTYAKDINNANYPQIRQFLVPTATDLQLPQNNIRNGHWIAAVGNNVRPFSAVAFFFAKKLFQQYQVPIGIINASVGGTPIEAWISENGLQNINYFDSIIQQNKDTNYVHKRILASNIPASKELKDAGLLSEIKWFSKAYQPKNWRSIHIPGYWEDQGIKDLNGVVWYRKEIEIPTSISEKEAKIFLGRIVDADELYINGKLVANTTYQYPQRRYTIPKGWLHTGKNTLVIRVTNYTNKGGFVPDKPYYLCTEKDTIDIKGTWQYKVGEVFTPFNNATNNNFSLQNQPTALFNAMVAPCTNYAIKGICWYQGESNTSKPQTYTQLLTSLIQDWRKHWHTDSLPFLYVQLPGFMEFNYLPSESNWALLREAQLKTLSASHTAMVTAIDLGEWNDIHPDNKKDVGERLALAAQKMAYQENIVYSGPIYQSHQINQHKIVLSFSHVGKGLISKDLEPLAEFAIAGSDKKFVWANAKIVGNTVVVWNDTIQHPMYVRYAWADNPVNPNLYNQEGLPASPFRTDN